MLKRMTLLARRHDRTFDQFSAHWLGTHGEIVRRMPMVQGYIQNPVDQRLLGTLNLQDPWSFDGIVELWFADVEAQKAAFASDAAKELPVDEMNFIRGITIFPVAEDRPEPRSCPLKVMVAARFGAAEDTAAQSADLATRLASLSGVTLVAVNHLGEAGWRDHLWHEPEPPQVLIELGVENEAALQSFVQDERLETTHAAHTRAGGKLECYLVRPRRII